MVDKFENPMGVDGFEFVEYAAPNAEQLHQYFRKLGFTAVARHRTRAVTLYRQNGVNFLVNEEPNSFASEFAAKHGPSACGFAIRVRDLAKARQLAADNGAKFVEQNVDSLPFQVPALQGIGGSALYLVDRYGERGEIYEQDFEFLTDDHNPKGVGLTFIDHLTHNVVFGNMKTWSDFYEKLFNFREIRYFDIKGAQTGLVSKAMTAPDGMVRIPLNESSDEKSQINEYLREYKGEGIQHIALFTDNIYDTVENLRSNGIEFLDTPDTYYEVIEEKIPNHNEDIPRMQKNKILMDADKETKTQKLLQIFTLNALGPIFFEIIQRKGNEGFGEGNFQALFESIERDQIKRGVL